MSLRAAALLAGLAAAVTAVAALALAAGRGPDRESIRPIELSGARAQARDSAAGGGTAAAPAGGTGEARAAGAAGSSRPATDRPSFAPPKADLLDDDPFDDDRLDEEIESREDDLDDSGDLDEPPASRFEGGAGDDD